MFLKTLIAPSESDETTTTPRVSGTVAVPVEQVEAGDRYVKYVLQPRQRLNVSKFIIARFVGLLPIMWLGLLINVPSWMNENNSRQPATTQVLLMFMSLPFLSTSATPCIASITTHGQHYVNSLGYGLCCASDSLLLSVTVTAMAMARHTYCINRYDDIDCDCDCVQVVCSALYIVAMQSWWRPQCGQYGPNNLLYASILINCFLIYVVLRYAHTVSPTIPLFFFFIPFILALPCIILPLETLYYLSCHPLPQSTRTMLSNSVLFAPSSLPLHSIYSTPLHSPLYTLLSSFYYPYIPSLSSTILISIFISLLSAQYSLLLSPLLISSPSL